MINRFIRLFSIPCQPQYGIGAEAKESSREVFEPLSIEQRLRIHGVAGVTAVARLNRPQYKPGKRGAIPKNAPPILIQLNQLSEPWVHLVERFHKRCTSNRITPASGFNVTATPTLQPVATQQAARGM